MEPNTRISLVNARGQLDSQFQSIRKRRPPALIYLTITFEKKTTIFNNNIMIFYNNIELTKKGVFYVFLLVSS